MNRSYYTQISFWLIFTFILYNSSSSIAQIKGGRWMFENNGSDEAVWDAVDNTGSLSGAASFLNINPIAQGNYYLSVEDSAQYGAFTVADQSELDFQDENFAVSLWAYPVLGYDNPQFLFMKGDRSGSVKLNNYALRINNDKIEFIVHSESGANKVAKSSFKIVNNEWNFIAVFYDYNQSKLYMWNDADSAPVDTVEFNAPLFPNDIKLYIGTSGQNGYKRFWGRIDDVRISNNVSDIFDNTTNVELSNIYLPPSKFVLDQNYPNPFNPETIIKFSLSEEGFTKLGVYNIIGEQVALLVSSRKPAGEYQLNFNANNLPSGVYFYHLQQGKFSDIKKMIFVK